MNTQLWFGNALVTVRVPHSAGKSGLSVLESLVPRNDSPPLHIHRTEDEVFHVLEGEITLLVDGETMGLGPGETLLAPRDVPHTYRVDSDTARLLVVTPSGDFESFVRATARPAEELRLPTPSGPPSQEEQQAFAEVAARHGIDLIGPPLAAG